MNKGFTLIELIFTITIMCIFAAVAVPKFFSIKCKSDMDKCMIEDSDMYKIVCENQHRTTRQEIIKHCEVHYYNKKEVVTNVQPEVKTVHDTIRVVDTIFVDISREACIKHCQENNHSQSVIDFCIKEECK